VYRVRQSVPGSKKVSELPPLPETLLPFAQGDELELDEVWTFVLKRKNKRWPGAHWAGLALCRRTRQIVAFAIGCRGVKTCRVLWSRIPHDYKAGRCFADIWDAYARVVPEESLEQSETYGPTNHIERFNRTLRQRVGRLTRQTASFSKSDLMHYIAVHLFIHDYNCAKAST
jgi:IS1 family transposase